MRFVSFSDPEYKKLLKEKDYVVVTLVPSSKTDLNALKFDWEISHLDSKEMKIKLIFERPEFISINDMKDVVKIQFFKGQEYMMSADGTQSNVLPNGFLIVHELPPLKAQKINEESSG